MARVVVGVAATVVTAAGLAAAPAVAAQEGDAAEQGKDRGTFTACPTRAELPDGADPAQWRCEVQTATGSLKVGRLNVPLDKPLVVTHAEGRIDGEFRQVFGGLKADPYPVPGTPLRVKLRYGGSFDFHSDDERVGELALIVGLDGGRSPLRLPAACAIGSDAEPVQLTLKAVGASEPGRLPAMEDRAFTAPRTSHCGRMGPVLDRALALPASSGENRIRLENDERSIRSYTELP
ncbi:hypothetical protein ACTWQF_29910 [Streptomyces sp. 8N114]|uniref:hypothetical protein n=1 Tax=Streptomyces sp. 8N114 TaxID=3457419 RepID=UPI003FD3483B